MVRVSPPGCRTQVGVQIRSLTTVLGGRGGKLAGLGALGGPGLLPFRLIGVAVGRGRCRGRELGVVSTRVQVPALRPRTLDTEAARRRDRHVGEILLETRLGCGRVPELALWPCALGAVTALGPDRCRRPQHPPLHRAGEGAGGEGGEGGGRVASRTARALSASGGAMSRTTYVENKAVRPASQPEIIWRWRGLPEGEIAEPLGGWFPHSWPPRPSQPVAAARRRHGRSRAGR